MILKLELEHHKADTFYNRYINTNHIVRCFYTIDDRNDYFTITMYTLDKEMIKYGINLNKTNCDKEASKSSLIRSFEAMMNSIAYYMVEPTDNVKTCKFETVKKKVEEIEKELSNDEIKGAINLIKNSI